MRRFGSIAERSRFETVMALSPMAFFLSQSGRPVNLNRSIIGRLARSIGALGFAQIFNIASNLMLVPLFLSFWKAERYGEWIALSALVAYLAASDFGMNSAASNALLSAFAKRDMCRYRSLQASALAFYIVVALAVTISAGMICACCPAADWLGVSHIGKATAALVIWLLAGRLMWTMPAGQIWNIFRSTGNLALTQWFVNANALLLTAVTGLVLVFHGGVLALAAWSWFPLFACAAFAWMTVRSYHPELLPRLSDANIGDTQSLLRPSIWFGVMMLASAICLNGPTVLVAHVFGGVAVALLVITRTLVNVVHQCIAILCSAIWPELTRLEGIGDFARLRVAHRLVTAVCIFVAVSLSGTLWFQGGGVLRLWTGGRLAADSPLLRGFLVYFAGRAPWFASSLIGMATNRNRSLAWHSLAAAVIGVGGAACLMPWLHLAAIPCGLLLGEALLCYHFVVRHACRMIHENYAKLALRTWSALIPACIASLLAGWTVDRAGIELTGLRWLLSGASTTAVAGLCVAGLFLQRSEREMVFDRTMRGLGLRSAALEVNVEIAQ
jgi:O-antigen/teichoic acid export membrane protein